MQIKAKDLLPILEADLEKLQNFIEEVKQMKEDASIRIDKDFHK